MVIFQFAMLVITRGYLLVYGSQQTPLFFATKLWEKDIDGSSLCGFPKIDGLEWEILLTQMRRGSPTLGDHHIQLCTLMLGLDGLIYRLVN